MSACVLVERACVRVRLVTCLLCSCREAVNTPMPSWRRPTVFATAGSNSNVTVGALFHGLWLRTLN